MRELCKSYIYIYLTPVFTLFHPHSTSTYTLMSLLQQTMPELGIKGGLLSPVSDQPDLKSGICPIQSWFVHKFPLHIHIYTCIHLHSTLGPLNVGLFFLGWIEILLKLERTNCGNHTFVPIQLQLYIIHIFMVHTHTHFPLLYVYIYIHTYIYIGQVLQMLAFPPLNRMKGIKMLVLCRAGAWVVDCRGCVTSMPLYHQMVGLTSLPTHLLSFFF